MTIAIGVARTADCPGLLSALEAAGVHGTLFEADDQVWVNIPDDETDPQQTDTQVLNAIDEWVVDLNVPLIVTRLDNHRYFVHPPAD